MNKLEVIEIGDELAVVFPDDVLKKLDCVVGDMVCLTEVPQGLHLRKMLISEIE